MSYKSLSEVASFLDRLNKSLKSVDTLCNEDKHDDIAVYDTIRDIMESLATLLDALGGAEKAKEIRKQGDFVKQVSNAFDDLDLDIKSSQECGTYGSFTALAKTLDDLAGIVESVGTEKLSKELGINLDFNKF
eukprot:GFUD01069446.1.p1 GENE.GFUD01069446.1~~GFUD01069446.1.p1  ORF type:complete len:133 (+),score=40.78 GFUD01069446.1:13-411(+)